MTIPLNKFDTQVILNSTDPGPKTVNIPGSDGGNDGFSLDIKDTVGIDPVMVVPSSGTIEGLPCIQFTGKCDLALRSNAAKSDWLIRWLNCYEPTPCEITGDAVYFDGMLTSLYKLAPLGADSPFLTFSYWIKVFNPEFNLLSKTVFGLLWPDASHPGFYYSESGLGVGSFGQLYLSNDGDTETQWVIAAGLNPFDQDRYVHIFGSIDASTNPVSGQVFRDEEDITDLSFSSAGGFIFPFSRWGLALPGVLPPINHSRDENRRSHWGDFWFAPGVLINFTNPDNRLLFHNITMTGVAPKDLGPNGELPTGSPPAVFFSGGKADFSTNRGTAGDFTLLGNLEDSVYGFRAPKLPPPRTRGGVRFNGTAGMGAERDILDPDSSLGAFSFFVRMSALPTDRAFIQSVSYPPGGFYKFAIEILPSGFIVVRLGNGSIVGAALVYTQTSGAIPADNQYHHVAGSFDSMSAVLQLFVDRNPVSFTTTGSGGFAVDFSSPTFNYYRWFGLDAGFPFPGDVAEYWCDITRLVDFSNPANMDKFVTTGMASVDLGENGELPTGSPPTFFFSQQPVDYAAVTFFINRADNTDLYGNDIGDMSFVTVAPSPYP